MMKSAKQVIFTGINGLILLILLIIVIFSQSLLVGLGMFCIFIVAEMLNSYYLWKDVQIKGEN